MRVRAEASCFGLSLRIVSVVWQSPAPITPAIARFYGIVIKMYFRDHGVPHLHAVYDEYNGVFAIETLEMIEGDLPSRARKLVTDWAHLYRDELRTVWENQEFRVLPGLDA